MPLTLNDLYTSPDHYLHAFEGEAAVFMPMDRAAYARSIFLDARISPAADRSMTVPIATLLPGARAAQPTAWIFHIAHCGSTLLARALDDPATSLVLREPLALRQSAVWKDATRLRIAAEMVSKRYRADAPTLVKANVPVNFVLPDIAGMQPRLRAILLYLPLRDYLLAILRSDNHRAWLRRVTGQLAGVIGDCSALPDAECAAALWQAQMTAFAGALGTLPGARSLDAERFFADPHTVLRAAASHLDLPLEPAVLDAVVEGPLFRTYSKNPAEAFDNAVRMERRDAIARAITDELAMAERWIAGRPDPAAVVRAAALVT